MFISKHPNIVELFAVQEEPAQINSLMALADLDMEHFLQDLENQKINISSEDVFNWVYQISAGLLFLKDKLNIAHRDLKPENLLVFKKGIKDCILKIADFDTIKITEHTVANTITGTIKYMVKIKILK